MPYHPEIHRRRSIRLPHYDYALDGAYYVTICVEQKLCLLGAVANGRTILNAAGAMVDRAWRNLPAVYAGVELDEFVVMPNHLHGILWLSDSELTLGEIIGRWKTWTMRQYGAGVNERGWPRYPGRLWQRNFWDRVIRNERELAKIRFYVQDNPRAWSEDDYHPARKDRRWLNQRQSHLPPAP